MPNQNKRQVDVFSSFGATQKYTTIGIFIGQNESILFSRYRSSPSLPPWMTTAGHMSINSQHSTVSFLLLSAPKGNEFMRPTELPTPLLSLGAVDSAIAATL